MSPIKKTKGAALQFVIFISIIIAVLLSSYLILSQTQLFFNSQHNFFKQTVAQANKGMSYSLSKENDIQDSISLPYEDIGVNTIKKKSYGGFLKIESTAAIKTKEFTKMD